VREREMRDNCACVINAKKTKEYTITANYTHKLSLSLSQTTNLFSVCGEEVVEFLQKRVAPHDLRRCVEMPRVGIPAQRRRRRHRFAVHRQVLSQMNSENVGTKCSEKGVYQMKYHSKVTTKASRLNCSKSQSMTL
jgi:hypothetical protein